MTQTTIVSAIRRHADTTPDRIAVRLIDGDRIEELDYRRLDAQARSRAAGLQQRLRPGDRVLIAQEDTRELVLSLLACLYAGVVPLNPGLPRGRDRSRAAALAAAVQDAEAAVALTTAAHRHRVDVLLQGAGVADVPCLVTDEGPAVPADDWREAVATGPDVAFLQYTSGSTGDPRGVMVTHAALTHTLRTIVSVCGGEPEETFCGWLPLNHDMGLVGQFLTPLFRGGTTVMLNPTDFVRHPLRWLTLLSRYRAQHTAAPTFALNLCCLRVTPDQARDLDLSALRVLLVGAEPVDAAVLRAFAERFAAAGLPSGAMTPAYGLAEATLMVTCAPPGRGPVTARVGTGGGDPERVACGPARGVDVTVVDPDERRVVGDGGTGEIWVRGTAIGAGYWRRPELTQRTFLARTADGDGPYLRTGDLGVLRDGELFVTGRLKESLVVNGRTLQPHDIEAALRARHRALAGLAGALFALADGAGREELVLVHEVRPPVRTPDAGAADLAGLAAAMRQGVGQEHGLAVANVLLVAPGAVPRTSSGKVRRLAVRDLLVDGGLRTLHADVTPAVRDRYLCPPGVGA